jgi:hypothetical protein
MDGPMRLCAVWPDLEECNRNKTKNLLKENTTQGNKLK